MGCILWEARTELILLGCVEWQVWLALVFSVVVTEGKLDLYVKGYGAVVRAKNVIVD